MEKLAEWLGGREGKVETAPSTLEIREGGMEKLSSAIIHRERGRETVSRVPRDRPRAVVCQIKRKTRGNCQRERVLPPEGWRQTRLGGQSAARSMFISSSFQFSRGIDALPEFDLRATMRNRYGDFSKLKINPTSILEHIVRVS